MFPVLVEIPFPSVQTALLPLWVLGAALGCLVAFLGRRAGDRDLLAAGIVALLLALGAAAVTRGRSVALGPMPIYSFGALLSLALLSAYLTALRLAERDGLSRRVVSWTSVVAVVAGLAGARLGYAAANPRDFESVADVLAYREGGLAFYGGVLGGALGSAAYLRLSSVPWLAWADVAAPAVALASVIGRLGCYLAGCDYGVPLGARAPSWLARLGSFPRWPEGETSGSPAWIDHVLTRGLSAESPRSLPVHPTQLYESLAGALLFAGLLALRARRPFRGSVFLALVAGYGAIRYVLEILRDDPERGFLGPALPAARLQTTGAAALALVFALGIGRGIRSTRGRAAAAILTICLVGGTYLALRGADVRVPLSTPQWLALGTSLAAAWGWRVAERAAPKAA